MSTSNWLPPVSHHEGFNSKNLTARPRKWSQKRTTIGVEEQPQHDVATEQLTVCDDKPHQLKTGLRPSQAPQHRLDSGRRGRQGKPCGNSDCHQGHHRTGWLRLHRWKALKAQQCKGKASAISAAQLNWKEHLKGTPGGVRAEIRETTGSTRRKAVSGLTEKRDEEQAGESRGGPRSDTGSI